MNNLQDSLFDRLEGSQWHGERYFSAYCPFEEHQKPALLVYADGYVCLSCNRSGNLKYLQNFLSRGIIPSGHKLSLKPILPRWSRWQRQYGDIDEIAYAAHRLAKDNRGYFKRRKIDQFFDAGKFGRLDGWLTFPVMDRNHEIIDIVVRAGKGKKDAGAKYVVSPASKDGLRPLYVPNYSRVLASDVLYVVYGIITAWALEAIELPVVTGITGKSLPAELLDDFHKPIIVVPDYDEDSAGARLVNNLGWRGTLKRIQYPDDCTDLDDIRRIYGNRALYESLRG